MDERRNPYAPGAILSQPARESNRVYPPASLAGIPRSNGRWRHDEPE